MLISRVLVVKIGHLIIINNSIKSASSIDNLILITTKVILIKVEAIP